MSIEAIVVVILFLVLPLLERLAQMAREREKRPTPGPPDARAPRAGAPPGGRTRRPPPLPPPMDPRGELASRGDANAGHVAEPSPEAELRRQAEPRHGVEPRRDARPRRDAVLRPERTAYRPLAVPRIPPAGVTSGNRLRARRPVRAGEQARAAASRRAWRGASLDLAEGIVLATILGPCRAVRPYEPPEHLAATPPAFATTPGRPSGTPPPSPPPATPPSSPAATPPPSSSTGGPGDQSAMGA